MQIINFYINLLMFQANRTFDNIAQTQRFADVWLMSGGDLGTALDPDALEATRVTMNELLTLELLFISSFVIFYLLFIIIFGVQGRNALSIFTESFIYNTHMVASLSKLLIICCLCTERINKMSWERKSRGKLGYH